MREEVALYPRPPRLVATGRHLVVKFAGQVIAETRRGWRVLETGHPPTYYFPPSAVRLEWFVPQQRRTYCEWKGVAHYFDIVGPDRRVRDAAWAYASPTPAFADLAGCLAFYAHLMDECLVDGEQVRPQAGGFYGGWITPDLVGPFKGDPDFRGN